MKNSVSSARSKTRRLTVTSRPMRLVHCQGFRRLAYQDEEGKWRDAFRASVLPEPVLLIEEKP